MAFTVYKKSDVIENDLYKLTKLVDILTYGINILVRGAVSASRSTRCL